MNDFFKRYYRRIIIKFCNSFFSFANFPTVFDKVNNPFFMRQANHPFLNFFPF